MINNAFPPLYILNTHPFLLFHLNCLLASSLVDWQVKEELNKKAQRRTTWVLWGGMAYMATQFGILARLTWWEYSWDIMEPVTYFITYGTAMAMYAYFVLTRQVRRDATRQAYDTYAYIHV